MLATSNITRRNVKMAVETLRRQICDSEKVKDKSAYLVTWLAEVESMLKREGNTDQRVTTEVGVLTV